MCLEARSVSTSDVFISQPKALLICMKTSENRWGLSDNLIRGLTGQSDP